MRCYTAVWKQFEQWYMLLVPSYQEFKGYDQSIFSLSVHIFNNTTQTASNGLVGRFVVPIFHHHFAIHHFLSFFTFDFHPSFHVSYIITITHIISNMNSPDSIHKKHISSTIFHITFHTLYSPEAVRACIFLSSDVL